MLIFLDMSKPDDAEEDASFIVYGVPGCSLHIYDYQKKKSQGQNYCAHFKDEKSEIQRTQLVERKILT